MHFIPKTKLGKWPLLLIVLTPILFYLGSSFTNTLYQSIPAGKTILQDVVDRPVLALTMLSGMLAGFSAFITGLISITKRKEEAIVVYIATILGALLTLFLLSHLFL